MDEIGVAQQYYIAAGSSPSDDRVRVLKYGKTFAVFNRYGDIEPLGLGEHGLFFQGTRYLSELALAVWHARPLLLSSTIKSNNFVFTADLANVDVGENERAAIARGTLHIVRSRFLWNGVCYEEIKVVNYGLTRVNVPLRVALGADYADDFEVRGMRRERRGRRLEDEISADSILMTYEGRHKMCAKQRSSAAERPNGFFLQAYILRPHWTQVNRSPFIFPSFVIPKWRRNRSWV